jgi:site-specific DNA-methyltransferase (adenine-specific)
MNAALPRAYRNRIICGDALKVLRELANGCIDLVVTSPPYNLRNSVSPLRGSNIWRKPALADGYEGYSDNLPHAQYVAWQRAVLTELLRLIPNDGAIFYNHKWRVQRGLIQDRQDIVSGLPVRQIIIWQRRGGINFNRSFFLPTYEVIYLIAKPKFKLVPGACGQGDVWAIGQEQHNPHPAPFPVELAERIIGSTDAQVVLDPFMGSGTTALAARHLGRSYVGIEQSPAYCAMAEARLTGTAWEAAA